MVPEQPLLHSSSTSKCTVNFNLRGERLEMPSEKMKIQIGPLLQVQLHYRCEVTGDTVTVSSTQWSAWLKATATLVSTGLCVVKGDVANLPGQVSMNISPFRRTSMWMGLPPAPFV